MLYKAHSPEHQDWIYQRQSYNNYKNMKIFISIETEKALKIVPKIFDYVDGFKINHLMLDQVNKYAYPELFKKDLFIDCKLWDTPNTVEKVTKRFIDKGATMTSICAHNSQDTFAKLKMLSADIKLVGVVSLTSWDLETERAVTNRVSYDMWNLALNKLRRHNFQHLVCPVTDLKLIQSIDFSGPNKFSYVCPGIVFEKETTGQTRTGTPKDAKDSGANYIILGRTVTEAENPNEVLVKIKGSL